MPIRKVIFITLAAVMVTGAGIAYYQYNKPQEDVAELKAQAVSASDLFKDFSTNEQQANRSYLNKALQVHGKVLEVKQNQNAQWQIILDAGDPMFGIACTLDKNRTTIKAGDDVTIKGICTGYLNDVILIRSFLLN